ncbi:Dihydrolipoyl dehydrogenase 3 [Serratia plymuthica]|nr:Dihydrolipoyl dehydrogenase 3 [Serratia plymuthica]
MCRRLAAKVTVVEYLDHVAHGTDLEAGNPCNPRSYATATTSDHGVSSSVEPADGGEVGLIEADYVLVAIGRQPYTKSLGLETIGLTVDKRGMLENKGHRTEAENVWVIGDVTSGPMLAHKAEDEATVCLGRIVGKAGEVNYNLIPNVIYTRPELASVGKTE